MMIENWTDIWPVIERELQEKLGTDKPVAHIWYYAWQADTNLIFTFRFFKENTESYTRRDDLFSVPRYILKDVDIHDKDYDTIKKLIEQDK